MKKKLSRILQRLATQIRIIVGGHILNPLWAGHDRRRQRRYEVTAGVVSDYLRRYAPGNLPDPLPDVSGSPEPERAFSIWLQGEEQAPPLVKACFRSMRRELTQEVVVLDENSIFDWITLPDYIIDKWHAGKIKAAHFSDICRVELLYEHGGIWVDATDFVTSPVPRFVMDADFFMFMAGKSISWWYSFVQNCFIRARKGDRLLALWRDAIFRYWKEENSIVNYLAHQLLFKMVTEENEEAARLFRRMPHVDQDPTHQLWFGHMHEPYDAAKYRKLTQDTFFQKTSYNSPGLDAVPKGSVAEYMLTL
ncbi:MAG: capsular polysaccharide synthesis protein [Muribaculaceae bacterium]|nr:capsular polysaccharide synthesis protein [Muribaculaceae bacterium]